MKRGRFVFEAKQGINEKDGSLIQKRIVTFQPKGSNYDSIRSYYGVKWEGEGARYENTEIDYTAINEITRRFYEGGNEAEVIYYGLKSDGQWTRYFTRVFNDMFLKLRNKRNDEFKSGKIPSDEMEFMIALRDVINYRIQVLEDSTCEMNSLL